MTDETRKTAKGTRTTKREDVPLPRWRDSDMDRLASAVAIALENIADALDTNIPEYNDAETEKRVTFLRMEAQEVQKLGIPF